MQVVVYEGPKDRNSYFNELRESLQDSALFEVSNAVKRVKPSNVFAILVRWNRRDGHPKRERFPGNH